MSIDLLRFRAHPHSLVGQNTTKGICYIADVITNSESPLIIHFPMLGIQSSRMNEIAAKLRQREILRIDPFRRKYIYSIVNNLKDLNKF